MGVVDNVSGNKIMTGSLLVKGGLMTLLVVIVGLQMVKTPQLLETIMTSLQEEPPTEASSLTTALESLTSTTEDDVLIATTTAEEATTTTAAPVVVNPFHNEEWVCQALNTIHHNHNDDTISSHLSAATLWASHIPQLYQASLFPLVQQPSMTNATWENVQHVTHNLLLDLTPSALKEALLVSPKKQDLQRILSIMEKRIRDPANAPPLRILIVGGSVSEGSGCNVDEKITTRSCNWSKRLESFVNAMAGTNVLEITNIAQGGTGTGQATALIKYWLFPKSYHDNPADVIIHSFGSNDSHLGVAPETQDELIASLMKGGLETLSNFVHTVRFSNPCPGPILWHLDEYAMGHSQGGIFSEMVYHMVVGQVAEWYEHFAISPAHVSRKRIYPDPSNEQVLSPRTKVNGKKQVRPNGPNRYKENCHFDWAGHQAIVWSFAYSFLQVVVNHCQEQDSLASYQTATAELGSGRSTYQTQRFQELQKSGVNPPPLKYDLFVEEIADRWKQEEQDYADHCTKTASMSSFNPCLMAWVAGPEGQTSHIASLAAYLNPFFGPDSKDPKQQGWGFQADVSHGWARKLGLVATKDASSGGTVQFEFLKTTKPLRKLTMQSLKSYGPEWEGSIANVQVKRRGNDDSWVAVVNQNVTAFHNSASSISYTTEFNLEGDGLPEGSDVRLEMKLVAGKNFKLTGMMLCSY